MLRAAPLRTLARTRVWYQASMANRVMVSAMLLSLSIVLAVGGTAYLSLHTLLDEVVANRLSMAANLARQRLQDHLESDVRDVEELARRSLVANGLIDSQGRGGYLRPFLYEHRQAHAEVVEIGLYDWAGEPLASSSGQPPRRNGLVAEAVMQRQPRIWRLSDAAGDRLLVAAPVRLPATGTLEGALISEVDLRALAAKVLSETPEGVRLSLVDGKGRIIFRSAARPFGDRQLTLAAPLEADDVVGPLELRVMAAMSEHEALGPLRQLQLVFAALALAAAGLTYWGARALARRVTEPLARLSAHAQEIASDGPAGLRELETQGHDEVAWTAMAFNAMVRSLRDVYGVLEERVRARTRELEHRELYLRAILDNFPFMIWLKDEESRFLAVNRVMSETCGKATPESMTGLSDLDVWPGELARAYRQDDREVMAARVEKVVEEPIQEQDGRKWFETFKKPVIDTGGRVLGTVGFARDITERKQAEEAMRLRDRAIMATSDGIVISDMTQPGQPVIFVNPAFEAITGYTMEEVAGRNCSFLQGADRGQPALAELRAAIAEGRECRVVLRNYRKDGQPFWNELTLSPVRDEAGQVTHFVGVQHDITRDIEARDALAASERRLALTIDALRDGLWDWNIRDDSVYQSPSWAAMLGYAPDEMTGRLDSFLRCLPGDEVERVTEAIQAHLEGETEVYVCEHRMRRKDGSEIWVSDRGRVVEWDDHGQPARMVGTIADITERYEAKREILGWMQRLDSILTLSPDAYVYFDAAGQVASVNLAFERMTGLLSGDVLGLPMADFAARLRGLADPTQPFPNLPGAYRQGHAGGETAQDGERDGVPAHIHLIRPAGRVLSFDLRVNASGDSGVLYLRDVTRETEVDRMKSEFLSTAAHELRTPMVSIMGFAELLLRRAYNPETARDMLETIHRQSTRLTGLLNELLDLARIEARAGKDFNYSVQPLAAVVRDSIAATASRGGQGAVHLELAEELPLVRMDAAKVQQALLNILSNAFKYSPEGGDVGVRLYARETEGGVQVCAAVRDQGIGMTAEQVARVFERFYRADPSGNIPGTGLGMSLVKEIMEIHGGGARVDSEPGAGTTVTLWLPAAVGETEALAA